MLIGALVLVAILLFWYNSRSDDEGSTPAAAVRVSTPAMTASPRARAPVTRRAAAASQHGTLRLRSIDATQGDIDPTLRLDLLARLQSVPPVTGGRSLFELSAAPAPVSAAKLHGPAVIPKPLPAANQPSAVSSVPHGERSFQILRIRQTDGKRRNESRFLFGWRQRVGRVRR